MAKSAPKALIRLGTDLDDRGAAMNPACPSGDSRRDGRIPALFAGGTGAGRKGRVLPAAFRRVDRQMARVDQVQINAFTREAMVRS